MRCSPLTVLKLRWNFKHKFVVEYLGDFENRNIHLGGPYFSILIFSWPTPKLVPNTFFNCSTEGWVSMISILFQFLNFIYVWIWVVWSPCSFLEFFSPFSLLFVLYRGLIFNYSNLSTFCVFNQRFFGSLSSFLKSFPPPPYPPSCTECWFFSRNSM